MSSGMRTNVILIAGALAIALWLVQKTPYAFMSSGPGDFVGGLGAGLLIGGLVAWMASRER